MIGLPIIYGRVHESERASGNRSLVSRFQRRNGFGLPVHSTAAQTTRGVTTTRDMRRPVATAHGAVA